MFELSFKNLRDPYFHSGLRLLGECREFSSHKLSYKVAKLIDAVGGESEVCEKLFVDLIKTFGAKIEKGQFEIPDDKLEDWSKSYEDWTATKVEIAQEKLPLAELDKVKFSPKELSALEPLLKL